ncbi:MAG: TonB-dependent receptor [Pseudomonadota bacterium]|nr:TonB-dependent receptor [Pseudomonadota bacterium]
MNDMNSGLGMLAAKLFTGVSIMALAVAPAFAQDAAAPAPTEDEQAESAPASETEGTIVVTGRRRALEAADQRKKNADSIIDSVVADDAGKLPDNSITEVLQRVQGVTIVRFSALNDPDHFSAEGSGIQVRGLSGVASRLNGREIFSTNGGRALSWGDVTPELMAAVDVYKSPTADLIEGGTGGQVDLRTKLPFDYKNDGPHVAATLEASRGDLYKKTDLAGSILLTNRWSTGIGDIGVLVDVARSRLSSESNFFRTEPYFRTKLLDGAGNLLPDDFFIPGGYDFGDENFQRYRTGIYGALQWAPSDDLQFTQTFFRSKYKNNQTSFGAFAALGPGDSTALAVDPDEALFDENNALLASDNVFVRSQGTFLANDGGLNSGGNGFSGTSETTTRDLSTSFTWNPGQGPLRISGAYQNVKSTSKSDGINIFRDVSFPTAYGIDLTSGLPEVTLPDSAFDTFADPASYFWSASMPHTEHNRGKLKTAQLDTDYELGEGFFKSIKVGARWADRKERDLNNGFSWSALGRGWNGDPQMTYANAAPGDVGIHEFDNFFHGDVAIPNMYFPSLDLLRRSRGEGRNELHSPPAAGFCGPAFASDLWWNCSAAGPADQTGYGGPGIRPTGFVLPQDETTFRTKTLAGYAMVRFGRDYAPGTIGISGNVGARIVRVTNESHGFIVTNGGTFTRDGVTETLLGTNNDACAAGIPGTCPDPRGGKASFTRILPALNLALEPNETMKARFAYNITMDLPTFNALRGSGNISIVRVRDPNCPAVGACPLPDIFAGFTAETGNPFLKPTMSNNLDLSFEWYPKAGTTFHVAAFYKRITNLPVYTVVERDVVLHFDDPATPAIEDRTETATVPANDYRNADKAATVKGLEVGGRAFFDMLPGLLSGLGVEANYTFIDSKNPGDSYLDIFGRRHNDIPLQGLSKHNYNLMLLYEKNPFSLRVAYSWRSKYLQTTTGNGTSPEYDYYPTPGVEDNRDDTPGSNRLKISLPVYGDAYGQLDVGGTYHVNKHLDLSIQANNITNSVQRTLMGGYPGGKLYTRSWFQSDRRIVFGAAVRF